MKKSKVSIKDVKLIEIDLGEIPLSLNNHLVKDTILKQIYHYHKRRDLNFGKDFPIRIITHGLWDNVRICFELERRLRIVEFWRLDKNNPSDFYVFSRDFGSSLFNPRDVVYT